MNNNESYDLAIAYRIYPGISKVPPVFSDNKLKMSELCLYSFRQALGELRFKLFAILDDCPDVYVDLFFKYFTTDQVEIIRVPQTGNAGTFGLQMKILLEQNYSDCLFFAEDDYFYLSSSIQKMIDFLRSEHKPDFITPFDHLDYYNHPLHSKSYKTNNYNNILWREAATTCMTFMTRHKVLSDTRNVFFTYTKKNYDNSLWLSLTKSNIFSPKFHIKLLKEYNQYPRFIAKLLLFGSLQLIFGKRYKLYAPKPSLSTHMDNVCLSPDIDWYDIFDKESRKINFLDL